MVLLPCAGPAPAPPSVQMPHTFHSIHGRSDLVPQLHRPPSCHLEESLAPLTGLWPRFRSHHSATPLQTSHHRPAHPWRHSDARPLGAASREPSTKPYCYCSTSSPSVTNLSLPLPWSYPANCWPILPVWGSYPASTVRPPSDCSAANLAVPRSRIRQYARWISSGPPTQQKKERL